MTDDDTDCGCIDNVLAPTMVEHLTHLYPPIYNYFWAVGSVLTVLTFIIILPKLIKVKREGIKIRNERNDIIIPFSYNITLFILNFPLFGTFGNMLILIAPITQLSFSLLLSVYLAFILFLFARLIVMYLGSFEAADHALINEAKATKFYASPPLCCCLKCFIKSK